MQKMWKQLGSESWGFQNPEVTKGFSPGECRSRWEVVGRVIVMVSSEKKEKRPLNWVTISGQTGWLHNADAQRERGM